MPPPIKPPFIFFSKEPAADSSPLSNAPIICRADTGFARRPAYEISQFLLRLPIYIEPLQESIRVKVVNEDLEGLLKGEPGYGSNKKLSISLDAFDAPKEMPCEHFIYQTLLRIQGLINKGYTIGINFSDIKAEDCISDSPAYQEKISKLSYQFGQRFLTYFSPPLTGKPTAETLLCSRHQVLNFAQFYDTQLAVNTYHYFQSMFDFYTFYHSEQRELHKKILTDYLIIPLESPTLAKELLRQLAEIYHDLNPIREIILIFKGESYRDDRQREVLFSELIEFIKTEQTNNALFNTLIQIILLTNPESTQALRSLRPAIEADKTGAFTALSDDAGFYLNTSTINTTLYRKAQIGRRCTITEQLQPWGKTHATTANFVIKSDISPDYRLSKDYSKDQLRATTTLSMTHQVTQKQVITQKVVAQIDVENDSTLERRSFKEPHCSYYLFETGYDIAALAQRIREWAIKNIENTTELELTLQQIGYSTAYYRDHFSKHHFLRQLIDDNNAPLDLAGKILGLALVKKGAGVDCIALPHYSATQLAPPLLDYVLSRTDFFLDGLVPDHILQLNKVQQTITLMNVVKHNHRRYLKDDLNHIPFRHCSILDLHNDYTYELLLSEEQLSGLDPHRKQILIELVTPLLNLFKPHERLSPHQIQDLEVRFKQLITFYFPENVRYMQVIEKLFSYFEVHNEDNLRILLQVLIAGHTAMADDLLGFFVFLDARCLLPQLYKLYFKYACNSYSLYSQITHLARYQHNQFFTYSEEEPIDQYKPFLRFAAETPEVSSVNEWPIYNQFCHACLLYLIKHQAGILAQNLDIFISELWTKLNLKFLKFTNNHTESATKMMALFVNQLISNDNGLSIEPLRYSFTLTDGLETLLDHCMVHHTLEEQIEHMGGLSFLWADVPYAIKHNDFNIVCPEMKLISSKINTSTKRYSVTAKELKSILDLYKAPHDDLNTHVFRYLGTQNLRKTIRFYRDLNHAFSLLSNDNTMLTDLKHLMFGYFVLTSTGENYKTHIDITEFSKEFNRFLATHALFKELLNHPDLPTLLHTCLTTLDMIMCRFKESEILGRTDLLTLLGANIKPLPDIFIRQFDKKDLMLFLSDHSEELSTILPHLSMSQLPMDLIETYINATDNLTNKRACLHMFKAVYKSLSISTLLKDSQKIALLLEQYNSVMQRCPDKQIDRLFISIMTEQRSFDLTLEFLDIFNTGMSHQTMDEDLKIKYIMFLSALVPNIDLLRTHPGIKRLLILILDDYLTNQNRDIHSHLSLCKTLALLEPHLAFNTLNTLLKAMRDDQTYGLLHNYPNLTALQYLGIAQWLQKLSTGSDSLTFLKRCILEPGCNIVDLFEFLKDMDAQSCMERIELCQAINVLGEKPIIEQLRYLSALSPDVVHDLLHLIRFYNLKPDQLISILRSANIPQSIETLYAELFARTPERYHYDEASLDQKLAMIHLKSSTEATDEPVDRSIQYDLKQDYLQIMSYMMSRSILTLDDERTFTVTQLNATQFKALFHSLKQRIIANDNPHTHRLMLIALCSEALYRTNGQFPRHTQLLCVLNTIRHGKQGIIHEIQTGEGKSLITAIHAVLLWAEGRTVDIVTENVQLARDGLHQFKRFYKYLNIPYANHIIESDSPHLSYIQNGINHSTVSGLSLFRIQMQLNDKPLPSNSSLLVDEFDATRNTAVSSNFASTINPLLHDIEFWPSIYEIILDFVQEKAIFLDNKCSKADDIKNLAHYFLLKNPSITLSKFFKKIPEALLNRLIESAQTAINLEENTDFMVVHKKKEHWFSYAAPIVRSTSRPDPNLNFGFVQPLLQTLLRLKYPSAKYPFLIEAASQTVAVISARNFFEHYRLSHGHIIGFTGTAGTAIELDEFYQDGFVAYQYPSFHIKRSQDLGIYSANGELPHYEMISGWITCHKESEPDLPILIITSSPEVTLKLSAYLIPRHRYSNFQSFHGHEETGEREETIILKAGDPHRITIANQSLSRGADIKTAHPRGMVVINTCTDITISERRQIEGRTGRNGAEGVFLSLIDMAIPEGADVVPVWAAHQALISRDRHTKRIKAVVLEEARYHLLTQLLIVKNEADHIIRQQFGTDYTLVNTNEYFSDLCIFNGFAETIYAQLTEEKMIVDESIKTTFYLSLLAQYNNTIYKWFDNELYNNFQATYLPIAIEVLTDRSPLDNIKIKALLPLSEILEMGWQVLGNQNISALFRILNTVEACFKPYFDGTYGFMHALGKTLKTTEIASTEMQCQLFKECLSEFVSMVRGSKKYSEQYLKETITHIQRDEWDNITLPKLSEIVPVIYRSLSIATSDLMLDNIILPIVIQVLSAGINLTFKAPKDATVEIRQKLDSEKKVAFQCIEQIKPFLSQPLKQLIVLVKDPSKLSFNFILDIIRPIINNEGFHAILLRFLNLVNLTEFIPFVGILPALFTILESQKDKSLKALLTPDTLISIIVEAAQFEPLKQALDKIQVNQLIPWIRSLDPAMIASLKRLPLIDFIRLCKMLAHPHFLSFLKALPSDMTYAQMNCALNADPISLSPKILPIILELKNYQSKHQAIADETARQFSLLKVKYALNLEGFKKGLARELFIAETEQATLDTAPPLTPLPAQNIGPEGVEDHPFTDALPVPELAPNTSLGIIEQTIEAQAATPPTSKQPIPWLRYIGYGAAIAALITYNLFLFSIPSVLVSIVFLSAIIAYPYLYQALGSSNKPLQRPIDGTGTIDSLAHPAAAPRVITQTSPGQDVELANATQTVNPSPLLPLIGLFAPQEPARTTALSDTSVLTQDVNTAIVFKI